MKKPYQITKKAKGLLLKRLSSFLQGPREVAPPAVRKWLEQNKGKKIIHARVGTQPIAAPLPTVLNKLTGGDFEKVRREAGYNDINHSYLILTLDDGQEYVLEKNHVVEVSKYHKPRKDEKSLDVELDKPLQINEFLHNAEQFQQKDNAPRGNFWQYDPTNNNCQYFVDDIVKGNAKDIDNTKALNQFSFQEEAPNTIRKIPKIAKAVTDIAATADRLIHGEGMKRKRKRKQYRKHKIY